MTTHSIHKQDTIDYVPLLFRILIQNLNQCIFNYAVLAFDETIALWMICGCHSLLGASHRMQLISKLSALVIYLNSKTAMPANKLIKKLGNCWCRVIMDWLSFTPFRKVVYTNNEIFKLIHTW